MTSSQVQADLFGNDIASACEAVVAAAGGAKRVGNAIWPDLGIEKGAQKLRDAINPSHKGRFDLPDIERLLRLGRESGCHALLAHLCESAGYDTPKPIVIEERKADLMEEATVTMQKLMAKFEALEAQQSNVTDIRR